MGFYILNPARAGRHVFRILFSMVSTSHLACYLDLTPWHWVLGILCRQSVRSRTTLLGLDGKVERLIILSGDLVVRLGGWGFTFAVSQLGPISQSVFRDLLYGKAGVLNSFPALAPTLGHLESSN